MNSKEAKGFGKVGPMNTVTRGFFGRGPRTAPNMNQYGVSNEQRGSLGRTSNRNEATKKNTLTSDNSVKLNNNNQTIGSSINGPLNNSSYQNLRTTNNPDLSSTIASMNNPNTSAAAVQNTLSYSMDAGRIGGGHNA